MAGGGRNLSTALVTSLLQGVEMYGIEDRWADIKQRFFDSEEHPITNDQLKGMWKKLVKMAKNPAHRRGVEHLTEEIWAKIIKLEAEG